MIPCYIFTAILYDIKLYRDYIACIMCLEFDRLETVIVYVLLKFCSVQKKEKKKNIKRFFTAEK